MLTLEIYAAQKEERGKLGKLFLFSVKKLVLTCISLTSITIVERAIWSLNRNSLRTLEEFCIWQQNWVAIYFFQQEVSKNYDDIWSAGKAYVMGIICPFPPIEIGLINLPKIGMILGLITPIFGRLVDPISIRERDRLCP